MCIRAACRLSVSGKVLQGHSLWGWAGVCGSFFSDLCGWVIKFMQETHWMYYLKLALCYICPATPIGLLLHFVFKQEGKGAAPH